MGLAAVGVAAVLAGCGVRLESPPPDLPSPDAAETARQSAVERSLALAALGTAATAGAGGAGDGGTTAEALERVTTDAGAHAAALGGLWSPPGWATPSPTPGEPSPTALPPAGPADVLAALTAAADLACTDAAVVEPADLATLLASVCLAQDDAAAGLAAALGAAPPMPPAALAGRDTPPSPAGLPDDAAAALGAAPDAAGLGRSLDAAGFALEVAAARTDASGPRTTVADLAAAHRAAARDVLQAAGVLGTAEDPRRAAYDVERDGSGAPLGAGSVVPAVEGDLATSWVAALGDVPPGARDAVLAEAGRAWATARAWGAPAATFPGLPDQAT